MDGYGAVSIMARIAAFAEMLCNAETTPVERNVDDAVDRFTCQIFAHRCQYELTSAGGIVSLHAQALDSTATEPTLIVEVGVTDERSMDTLRACVSALEMISVARDQKNVAGLRMLQHVLDRGAWRSARPSARPTLALKGVAGGMFCDALDNC
jgi:hypothetical protein